MSFMLSKCLPKAVQMRLDAYEFLELLQQSKSYAITPLK